MKTILITGFDPFGGEAVNPSWESVRRLPDEISGHRIVKLQIPTVFEKAVDTVLAKAKALSPDAVVCVGQAGGRSAITPEAVGINLKEATIPDNEGNRPTNVPIAKNAPAAYFATLPIRDIVAKLNEHGIPASLSYSAGAFVCNEVLYSLLRHFDGTATKAGFIHVPFLPEQAKGKFPSLPLETITQGLELAVSVL